jgi:hypothetical protein
MSTFGAFSYDDALEIKRRVLNSSSSQKPFDEARKMLGQADKYYVRLDQDLAQATNPLTGYTQAEARPVRYVPGQDSLDMDIVEDASNPPIIVTNRSESFSASLGNVIQVHRVNSEWAPIHAAGGGNSAEEKCPCYCLNIGDILVRGEMAPFYYSINVPRLVWELKDVNIVLPTNPALFLSWDESRGLWVVDIGHLLEVYDKGGSEVTSAVSVEGEATITYPESGDPQLRICVTYNGQQTSTPPLDYAAGYSVGYQYGSENGYADGLVNGEYNNTVLFTGSVGTGGGVGTFQNFGTGTVLEPGTGTYGEETGTGTGTGTFQWSDYEEGFYAGYRIGYDVGYQLGLDVYNETGTFVGTGTTFP